MTALSKENRRFKAKIAELESKLTADAEQASNSQQLASESVISQLLAKSQATQQQLEQLKASQLVELESANSLQTSETESPNAEDQNSAPLKQAVEGTERQLAEIKVIIEFLQREMNVG